ncbi:MAG: hypothetical protein KBD07_01120 [Candidatus Omnitrophica bacterium]|nr:hypothetical protein [Candidatus Omnitrophota bacterium]
MRRKSSWARIAVAAALLAVLTACAGGFFYIKAKQGVWTERFRQYLTARLSQAFDLKVDIGSITGDPRGTIALKDVRVSVEDGDHPLMDIFTCGEVRFRYTLLDFFRQNYTSWFDVILDKPVFYANVPFSAQAPKARSFELFSGFIQKIKATSRLIIRQGTIAWIGREGDVSAIDGTLANRSFDITVTLNHIKIGLFDTTTTLKMDGQLVKDGQSQLGARLTGSASTQGTVINWKPVPRESSVHFDLSQDRLKLWDTEFLGGIRIDGVIGHSSRRDVDVTLSAKDYPLQEMHDMLSFSGSQAVGGKLSGRLKVQGALTEPRMAGELFIEGNTAPGARFRSLQLFFEGIYPQMKISRSQMVLANGNPMQFASDQEVSLQEMFSADTYERLIASSEQRTVTWKNWTLYREGDKDTVLLEHPLSPANDRSYAQEDAADTENAPDAPPSLETLLSGQDSLNMELKDDEQMFTLQKKALF